MVQYPQKSMYLMYLKLFFVPKSNIEVSVYHWLYTFNS